MMKKSILIASLAFGLMSFNNETITIIVNCEDQAIDYTMQEGEALGFSNWGEILDAYNDYLEQCLSMN